jgi:hypothetical protein
MGRFGQPTEIAALVAWLASEEYSLSTSGAFDISGACHLLNLPGQHAGLVSQIFSPTTARGGMHQT